MQKIIEISQGVVRKPEWRMKRPVDFTLLDGEHIAIVGPNGGGKTMLVNILLGRHPLLRQDPSYDFAPSTRPLVSDNMKYIAFRDSYGQSDSNYYLQQRWNQAEIDEHAPTVADELGRAYVESGKDTADHRALREELYDMFEVRHLLDKPLIMLSSGELRKYELIKMLLTSPRVLVMDNPFIGLDAETRDLLREMLERLTQRHRLQIILVLSKTDDIPSFTTHVVPVGGMTVGRKQTLADYLRDRPSLPTRVLSDEKERAILGLQPAQEPPLQATHAEATTPPSIVDCHNVSIVYGERVILSGLDWTVREGERWALSGRNGSGKSTLLSLICADNPQSYACDIDLFGRKRGSGESIWDIKRHIGYVSPEMHRAYQKNLPAINIVASGLYDSVGLYVKPHAEQLGQCKFWMDMFGLEGKDTRPFLQLSSGEQRLVLIARAFVKDPDLLILDEPLHGLDDRNRRLVKDVIDVFCRRPRKTMIMVTHYKSELPACITNSLWLERHV